MSQHPGEDQGVHQGSVEEDYRRGERIKIRMVSQR